MSILIWSIVIFLGLVWFGVALIGPPYVPTHQRQLKTLFKELEIGPDSHIVDLGSGDGRVLLSAMKRGAKVTGVEINPFLVWLTRFRLRNYQRAKIHIRDIWQYKLPEDTTHVFVFFADSFMPRLEKYLRRQNKSIILVSYGFKLPNRQASRVIGGFNIYQIEPVYMTKIGKIT